MPRINAPAAPVLHTILAQGPRELSHRELANIGKFSTRSVGNVVDRYKGRGLIVGGHPVKLGPGLGLCLGVSVGRQSLRAGLVDANGDIYHWVDRPAEPAQLEGRMQDLLERIRDICTEVLTAGVQDDALHVGPKRQLKLLGVSVAWACPVDRAGRPGGNSLKDRAWSRPVSTPIGPRIPTLRERVAAALGPPFEAHHVYALNDANAHAMAVVFSGSRRRGGEPEDGRWRVALVVRVSGGLGAATVLAAPHTENRLSFIDSILITGTDGFAGELGHAPIDRAIITERNKDRPEGLAPFDYDKARCSCGKGHHHLEAFAGGDALLARLEASGLKVPEGSQGGTRLARSIFEGEVSSDHEHALIDVGRILGRAVATPVLTLDPFSITLTGSLAYEQLKQGMQLERDVWKSAIGDHVKVLLLPGNENVEAGVRGAAMAMIRNFVYRQLEAVIDGKQEIGIPLEFPRS